MENEKTEKTESKKIPVLKPVFNSFENAYIEELDNSELSARNARNKYTKRKHWIETNKKGDMRYCFSTYDSKRNYWCKPKKSTYSAFVALVKIDNEIFRTGFSTWTEVERIEKLKNKYSFYPEQLEKIDSHIKFINLANKAYNKAHDDAKKSFEKTRKSKDDFKVNTLYRKNEITKCSDNLELTKIYLNGKGVKKRCKKQDYILDDLFYYIHDGGKSHSEMLELSKNKAMEHIKEKYRYIDHVNLCFKSCTYNAPTNGSMMYGMQEMLNIGIPHKGVKLELSL